MFERDGLQCSFVSEDGERCASRSFLELDHVTPCALGGSGETTNVRVFCRAHNRHAADRVFGRTHVEARIRRRRKESLPQLACEMPSVEPRDFSQRKRKTTFPTGPATPNAAEVSVLGPNHDDDAQTSDDDTKTQVRGALLALGFRRDATDRALFTIDRKEDEATWRRPVETILRETLAILT